ncbi:hypothetical protein RB594_004285 [Gaeumannomyces avenae]
MSRYSSDRQSLSGANERTSSGRSREDYSDRGKHDRRDSSSRGTYRRNEYTENRDHGFRDRPRREYSRDDHDHGSPDAPRPAPPTGPKRSAPSTRPAPAQVSSNGATSISNPLGGKQDRSSPSEQLVQLVCDWSASVSKQAAAQLRKDEQNKFYEQREESYQRLKKSQRNDYPSISQQHEQFRDRAKADLDTATKDYESHKNKTLELADKFAMVIHTALPETMAVQRSGSLSEVDRNTVEKNIMDAFHSKWNNCQQKLDNNIKRLGDNSYGLEVMKRELEIVKREKTSQKEELEVVKREQISQKEELEVVKKEQTSQKEELAALKLAWDKEREELRRERHELWSAWAKERSELTSAWAKERSELTSASAKERSELTAVWEEERSKLTSALEGEANGLQSLKSDLDRLRDRATQLECATRVLDNDVFDRWWDFVDNQLPIITKDMEEIKAMPRPAADTAGGATHVCDGAKAAEKLQAEFSGLQAQVTSLSRQGSAADIQAKITPHLDAIIGSFGQLIDGVKNRLAFLENASRGQFKDGFKQLAEELMQKHTSLRSEVQQKFDQLDLIITQLDSQYQNITTKQMADRIAQYYHSTQPLTEQIYTDIRQVAKRQDRMEEHIKSISEEPRHKRPRMTPNAGMQPMPNGHGS